MKNIFTITKREFLAYFHSAIAYVYLAVFLLVISWIFLRQFFVLGEADLRVFFSFTPWVFLFFVPATAMSKWSEEQKQGTLEVLCTLPVHDYQLILGKFFAGLSLIATALLLTLPLAFTVSFLGPLDWGPVIGGYLGLLFLGGSYLAIGLMVSSLTKNQIVAFLLGVLFCFFIYVLGTPLVTGGSRSLFAQLLQYLGLGMHFQSIARGVIDSRDIIYYLSVITFFLYLNYTILLHKTKHA